MEQDTRTQVNKKLENLGWILEGPRKNVFQERPRTEGERTALGRLRPDYVLYATDSNRYQPIAIIETKTYQKKGLDGAVVQAEKYAEKLKAPLVFATDGVYVKTKHRGVQRALVYNGEELDDLVN